MDGKPRRPIVVLSLRGQISIPQAERLRDLMKEVLDRGHTHVLLNFTQVEYIDSCGLGALVEAKRQLRQRGGDLGVFGLNRRVEEIFAMMDLNRVFPVFPDAARGIQEFRKRG
ncbi:MAG: STAS domain-containing protein [bacterium]